MTGTSPPRDLLIAALHAIYHDGRWHGGFPGEESFYAEHIETAVELWRAGRYRYLSLSGGRTRPSLDNQTAGKSEAEGALGYALEKRLLSKADDRLLLENWARDSMENLYFSMLAYFQRTRRWPA